MKKLFLTLLTFVTFSVSADELTLSFIRSPLGINWANPNTMAVSTIKNSLVPMSKRAFSISHVFVDLKCDSIGYQRKAGMTSTTDEDRDLIMKKGYGFGVIFHTYPGKLENDSEIQKDLKSYEGSRRVAQLNLKINPLTCVRLKNYLEEYEAYGFGSMYSGLQARPRKGEGAGCSAFAVSFLEIAGLMQEEWKEEWMNTIHVPTRLIGGPLTGRFVNVSKIALNPFLTWNSRKPHIYLEAWNPEKMWKWTRDTWAKKSKFSGWKKSRIGKTRIISKDMSFYPIPDDPIWQF